MGCLKIFERGKINIFYKTFFNFFPYLYWSTACTFQRRQYSTWLGLLSHQQSMSSASVQMLWRKKYNFNPSTCKIQNILNPPNFANMLTMASWSAPFMTSDTDEVVGRQIVCTRIRLSPSKLSKEWIWVVTIIIRCSCFLPFEDV